MQTLQTNTIDFKHRRAVLRRLIIQAIKRQFKNGLMLERGHTIGPARMINLIANFDEEGEPV